MGHQLSFEEFLLQQSDTVLEQVRDASQRESWLECDRQTDLWVQIADALKTWENTSVAHQEGWAF